MIVLTKRLHSTKESPYSNQFKGHHNYPFIMRYDESEIDLDLLGFKMEKIREWLLESMSTLGMGVALGKSNTPQYQAFKKKYDLYLGELRHLKKIYREARKRKNDLS